MLHFMEPEFHYRIHNIPLPLCDCFVPWLNFYGVEFIALHLTDNPEGHHLSAVRDYLYYIFPATFHVCRPFLQPQHEEAPCRDDWDSLITDANTETRNIWEKQCIPFLFTEFQHLPAISIQ